jgi:hypothetical protein
MMSSNSSEEDKAKVVNQKLLAKLNARGETLDERKDRLRRNIVAMTQMYIKGEGAFFIQTKP